jgi:ketosteroid isomerase-like protein
MPDQPSPEVELLRAAYAAFNARDFDAAFATMAPDVAWPRAFKGGVVRGHQEVRAYWTEQWSEIDPHVEPVSFHLEGAGESWSMCTKSCATWTGPFLVMNTLATVSPSKTA